MNHRLPVGYVRMPGSRTLNSALAPFDLAADVLVVDCGAGHPFGRRAAFDAGVPEDHKDYKTPEYLDGAREILVESVNELAEVLGLGTTQVRNRITGETVTRPRLTSVGFSPAPHKIAPSDLVQVMHEGAGYLPGEDMPPCLAVVAPLDLYPGYALLVPFADAPPVVGAYIGKPVAGKKPIVITFEIMATWTQLSGQYDPGKDYAEDGEPEPMDLIGRTLDAVRKEVVKAGGIYNPANLYVFVGPGASEDFEFKGSRSDKLSPEDRDRYVHTKLLSEDDEEEMPYLNLRGWVTDLLRRAHVPVDHVFELAHNTVNSLCYASKRTRLGRQHSTVKDVLPSNAIVILVREKRPEDAAL